MLNSFKILNNFQKPQIVKIYQEICQFKKIKNKNENKKLTKEGFLQNIDQ